MSLPTANHVAWAIVAACRETGDNPIDTASGVANASHGGSKAIRARHYAMHALILVFPDLKKSRAAELVGAPGKPMSFYNNSITGVTKRRSDGGRQARWWSEDSFERVISAVRRVAAEVKPAPPVVERVKPPRPCATPGKSKLEDMLRAAVQNTQRMTPPPEKQP